MDEHKEGDRRTPSAGGIAPRKMETEATGEGPDDSEGSAQLVEISMDLPALPAKYVGVFKDPPLMILLTRKGYAWTQQADHKMPAIKDITQKNPTQYLFHVGTESNRHGGLVLNSLEFALQHGFMLAPKERCDCNYKAEEAATEFLKERLKLQEQCLSPMARETLVTATRRGYLLVKQMKMVGWEKLSRATT